MHWIAAPVIAGFGGYSNGFTTVIDFAQAANHAQGQNHNAVTVTPVCAGLSALVCHRPASMQDYRPMTWPAPIDREEYTMFSKCQQAAAMIAAAAAALCAVSPAVAHHSFAMFDQAKVSTKVRATVSEFRFTNPHSFVVVNVKEGNGVTRYALECSSVNMMARAGWKHNTLKAGDTVDITFYPLRNGKPGGMLKTIKVADGRTLSGW